jgi:hypothetical protein
MKCPSCLCVVLLTALLAFGRTQPLHADDPQTRRQLITGAMAQLNVAKTTGDLEVVRAFIWCANDPDRKMADAQARTLIARYAFYVASVSRFGEQETDRLRRQFDLDTPDGLMLLAVDWKVDGDKATPTDDSGLEVVLRRVNGVWRLDMTPDPAPTALIVAQQAKAIEQIVEGLKGNRYPTPDDLTRQLKKAGIARPPDK